MVFDQALDKSAICNLQSAIILEITSLPIRILRDERQQNQRLGELHKIAHMRERGLIEVRIGGRVADQADVGGELQGRYVVATANIAAVLEQPDTARAQLVGERAGEGDQLRRGHSATSAAR